MLNKKKKNTAVERTNKLKYVAKGLKGIKAISNALGTKPTDTPDVCLLYTSPRPRDS